MARRTLATITLGCHCENPRITVSHGGNAVVFGLYCRHSSTSSKFSTAQARDASVRVVYGEFGEFIDDIDLDRQA